MKKQGYKENTRLSIFFIVSVFVVLTIGGFLIMGSDVLLKNLSTEIGVNKSTLGSSTQQKQDKINFQKKISCNINSGDSESASKKYKATFTAYLRKIDGKYQVRTVGDGKVQVNNLGNVQNKDVINVRCDSGWVVNNNQENNIQNNKISAFCIPQDNHQVVVGVLNDVYKSNKKGLRIIAGFGNSVDNDGRNPFSADDYINNMAIVKCSKTDIFDPAQLFSTRR